MCQLAMFAFIILVLTAAGTNGQTQHTEALDLMTLAQRRDIGVDHMTSAQKAALSEFIQDLVQKSYNMGRSKCESSVLSPDLSTGQRSAKSYITGGGHWIQENSGGKIITLEDGSLWQIHGVDQVDTVLWLPVTNITVMRDSRAVGDYSYILINKDDGERAHAKFLGRE